MTRPMPDYRSSRARPKVDAAQLWAGGVATAIVAGLVALAGVLISRWLLGIPILAPQSVGAYGNIHTTTFVLAAAAAALVATALAHLLSLSAPRPATFLAWILGLATLIIVVFPFSTAAPLTQKTATAVVDLAIGIAIGSLLSGVLARAIKWQVYPPPGQYPSGHGQYQDYGHTQAWDDRDRY
jgi:Family of unknown function (DUF6069)